LIEEFFLISEIEKFVIIKKITFVANNIYGK